MSDFIIVSQPQRVMSLSLYFITFYKQSPQGYNAQYLGTHKNSK